MDTLEVIGARRSISRLTDPAPAAAELHRILEAAVAAPDHGGLRPWKLFILQGEAKVAFGNVLAEAYLGRCAAAGAEPHPAKLQKERTKLSRAPLVVVVAMRYRGATAIPWVEQFASAAAAAQNILLAATSLGYGSMWRTGEPAYDHHVKQALGLTGRDDAIVGFLYLGTIAEGCRSPHPRLPCDGVAEVWVPLQ